MRSSLIVAALATALAACSSGSSSQSGAQSANAITQPTRAPAPAAPSGGIEQTGLVSMQLTASDFDAAKGETEIAVWLDVNVPLDFSASLSATAPQGAVIASGLAQDSIQLAQSGRQVRVFLVRSSAPLSADAPFKVVLHGASSDGAAGVHTEKQLPERPKTSPASPAGPFQGRPSRPAGPPPSGPIEAPPHG